MSPPRAISNPVVNNRSWEYALAVPKFTRNSRKFSLTSLPRLSRRVFCSVVKKSSNRRSRSNDGPDWFRKVTGTATGGHIVRDYRELWIRNSFSVAR